MVHLLAGDGLHRPHSPRRAPACLGARAILVQRALARGGPRARPVRPADDRRRDRVSRAPPGRGRTVGVGDPARPRLLQRRGRRARGRRVLGRSRRTALGRRGDARRRPCAATAAADGAAARAGAGVGRLDRVPLLLHLVRRDRRPRRNPPLHPRDGDLQPGGSVLRPAHGRCARPPPARRRRGGRDRLRDARAPSRRRAPSRPAGPEAVRQPPVCGLRHRPDVGRAAPAPAARARAALAPRGGRLRHRPFRRRCSTRRPPCS